MNMPRARANGYMRVPPAPPPAYIPPKPSVSYMIDCINKDSYVWLRNGESFWFFPVYLQSFGVAGFRWNGVTWVFYGFDPRLVDAVACPPIPTLF
ncbi:transporter [Cohnella yongneupensis]|uniref:Transporter n=1 Tax=Cohnella yongneupensis TaxID=425006 RepID=A0ABW0QTV2_9BACL